MGKKRGRSLAGQPGSNKGGRNAPKRHKFSKNKNKGGGGLAAAAARAAAAAAALSKGPEEASPKKKKHKTKKHKGKKKRKSDNKFTPRTANGKLREHAPSRAKEPTKSSAVLNTENITYSRFATKPPRPFRPANISNNVKFLTPDNHDAFRELHKRSYRGLAFDGASVLPESLHDAVTVALDDMYRQGLFHRDVVQAGRSVSATFVDRTLLGNPGMTYYYQKLRIFAHPWSDEYTSEGSPFRVIKSLNDALMSRTRLLADADTTSVKGKTNFNISLINRMDSLLDANSGVWPLRAEAQFGLGDASVSWHADSSLQDFSSIAIYHQTGRLNTDRGDTASWAVAARVIGDETTPAIKVHLKDRQTYYMLNDFNHHHHHAVIAGSVWRYSSTHRVGVVARDTLDFIVQNSSEGKIYYSNCLHFLSWICNQMSETSPQEESSVDQSANIADLHSSLRKAAEAHIELEFEWLRMFWIQGQKHADSHHAYWAPHMAKLHLDWSRFEVSAMQCGLKLLEAMILQEDYLRLSDNSVSKRDAKAFIRCASIYLWFLQELLEKRAEFKKRMQAKAYSRIPPDERPLELPNAVLAIGESTLDDLPLMINEVRQAKSSLMSALSS